MQKVGRQDYCNSIYNWNNRKRSTLEVSGRELTQILALTYRAIEINHSKCQDKLPP